MFSQPLIACMFVHENILQVKCIITKDQAFKILNQEIKSNMFDELNMSRNRTSTANLNKCRLKWCSSIFQCIRLIIDQFIFQTFEGKH